VKRIDDDKDLYGDEEIEVKMNTNEKMLFINDDDVERIEESN